MYIFDAFQISIRVVVVLFLFFFTYFMFLVPPILKHFFYIWNAIFVLLIFFSKFQMFSLKGIYAVLNGVFVMLKIRPKFCQFDDIYIYMKKKFYSDFRDFFLSFNKVLFIICEWFSPISICIFINDKRWRWFCACVQE